MADNSRLLCVVEDVALNVDAKLFVEAALDRDNQKRTAYSLRHTYICLRLMEGANIYQIAKNCRTSVEMIEKHYAAHIKNRLDTTLINIRKPKPAPKRSEAVTPAKAAPGTEPPSEDRAA